MITFHNRTLQGNKEEDEDNVDSAVSSSGSKEKRMVKVRERFRRESRREKRPTVREGDRETNIRERCYLVFSSFCLLFFICCINRIMKY